jgi:hypothetical protein
MAAVMENKGKRKSLMNQFNKLEREYEKLMNNIPKGGLSKKDDDRRRELQLMLRQIGSDLGEMEPADKQFP